MNRDSLGLAVPAHVLLRFWLSGKLKGDCAMGHGWGAAALGAVAVISLGVAPAKALNIGVAGLNNNGSIELFLDGQGHNATDFGMFVPTGAVYSGLDAFVLLRQAGNADLQNFVLGGGLLITEWAASEWALDTANLLNADDNGGGLIGNAVSVTFTPAGISAGLSSGIGASYGDTGRTDFFRTLANLGAGVDVLATRPGDIPAIVGGVSGAGHTLIVGYDWADGFGAANAGTRQLLLNALTFGTAAGEVSEPESLGLLGFGLLAAALARKRMRPSPSSRLTE